MRPAKVLVVAVRDSMVAQGERAAGDAPKKLDLLEKNE